MKTKLSLAFLVFLMLASCDLFVTPAPTATLEPTATSTATLPPPRPTIPPTATSTMDSYPPITTLAVSPSPAPGWETYTNDFLGYSINVPSGAQIVERGPGGMDMTEVIPPGFTFDEYFDYVMDLLPEKLCVTIAIPGAHITISPPYDPLGSYASPCPGMGIGSQYNMENAHQTLYIAGQEYTSVQGDKLYLKSTGVFDSEFYLFDLENGFRLVYNGGPRGEISYESYLFQRGLAEQSISTLHWYRVPDLTKPGTTCAGKFTRLVRTVDAVVVGEDALDVRNAPKAGDPPIGQLTPGTVVTILEGPVCADGLVFWEVEGDSLPGGTGWAAEGDGTIYRLEPYRP